jgi:general secretion pathway protein A
VSLNYFKSTPSLVDFRSETDLGGADTLTYENYFGLTEKPFSLNADARFVYESPGYVATRDSLLAGIRRREGLLVLTGQIGTGKTTLCREALSRLGRSTYSSLVPDPFASREDLLKMMLIDFGALSIQELTAGSLRQASRTELGYLLSDFLEKLPRDAFAITIIDEAQNLSLPLIEETRILSDTFGAKGRLQIVFVGQPELHAKLKSPEMRQVDQRVCGYHRLVPMDRDAVAGYIEHRLRTAGVRPGRVLFAPQIVDSLHARTGGVPRLINRVCDRALMLAHQKQAESVSREVLDESMVEIGAATLSPTWDAIVHAEPAPVAPATPLPAPAPVAEAAPVPVAPAALPPSSGDRDGALDEDFKKEVAYWLTQELASPSRPASHSRQAPVEGTRREQRPTHAGVASRRDGHPHRHWTSDLRSETYMQRLGRIWARWFGVAVAVAVLAYAGMYAATYATPLVGSPMLPAAPVAPKPSLPAVAPLEPPSAAAASADYLVAVGLFADERRASQLVASLINEGLSALQRTLTVNDAEVEQVVLGPFFSRPEAVAELVRLQQLGGFRDAVVVDVARDR